MSNFGNLAGESKQPSESGGDTYEDPEDTPEIKEAKRNPAEPEEFTYTERDVLLYNLGIGAKADELQWVYENAEGFQVGVRTWLVTKR
jgi:multifunctional beta-oxidation protein